MLVTELQRYFPGAKRLGLDIETMGLEWWLHRPVLLQLSDGKDAISIDLRPYVGQPRATQLQEWLIEEVYDRQVIAHNAMFDLCFLKYHFNVGYPDSIWDTRLAEDIRHCGLSDPFNPELHSSSLKHTTWRYLGVEMDKANQLSFLAENGFDFDTSEFTQDQIDYGEDDVIYLPGIMDRQVAHLREERLEEIAQIEMDVLPVFAEMRVRGVKVDRNRLEPLLQRAIEERDELETQLQGEMTSYVYFERMQKYKEQIRPRVEYRAAVRQITDKARQEWEDHQHWYETTSAGGSPTHQKWYDDNYADRSPHDKKPWSKGCQRFIATKVKEYREAQGGMPGKPNFSPFDPINLNSPDQIKIAFENLGLDLVNTRKGTLKAVLGQTDDDDVVRILSMYLDYRKREKIRSSFGDPLLSRLDEWDRVHGDYNQIISTGRPSSNNPNMLNMPNDPTFRACFVAEDGMVFIICDYSQIEYRIMAEQAGETKILDAYRTGADFHARTASELFGIPESEVTKAQRATAKVFNFGINYGMKKGTLRANMAEQQIYVTLDEAGEWEENYNKGYSKLTKYRENEGYKALRRGYAMTPMGRKRYFDLGSIENQWDRFGIMRQAANMPIQGGNADIMKVAMRVVQDLIEPYGASVVLQIYDELVVEAPEEYAEEVAKRVRAGMVAAAELIVTEIPAEVDCFISPSWSEDEGRKVAA